MAQPDVTGFIFTVHDTANFVRAQHMRWRLLHDEDMRQHLDRDVHAALLASVDDSLESIWQSIRDDRSKNTCWRLQPEGASTPLHVTLTWSPFGDSTFREAFDAMEALFWTSNPNRAAFHGTLLAEPPPTCLLSQPERQRNRDTVLARARAADALIRACDDMDVNVLERSFITSRRTGRDGYPMVLTAEQTRLLVLERQFIARWMEAHAGCEDADAACRDDDEVRGCDAGCAAGVIMSWCAPRAHMTRRAR